MFKNAGKKLPSIVPTAVTDTQYTMSMRKSTSYQKEFDWLYYSFVAAQQFFKDE
jgi:hypothetical protein